MSQTRLQLKARRRNLRQLQKLFYGEYYLPNRLFQCESSNELTDFEITDYNRFLDTVETLEDLIEGLAELSPFADDALDVAESMTANDFTIFKLALIHERKIAFRLKDWNPNQLILIDIPGEEIPESKMPSQFAPILLPIKFIDAHFIAKIAQTSLSVAMIHNLEEAVRIK